MELWGFWGGDWVVVFGSCNGYEWEYLGLIGDKWWINVDLLGWEYVF